MSSEFKKLSYGERLSSLIKLRSLTKRELAKKYRLNESNISLYISNKRRPVLKNHIKIYESLQVKSHFFTHVLYL